MISTGKTIRLRRTLRALDHPLIILGVVIDIVLIATICVQVSSPPALSSTTPAPTFAAQPVILIATAAPAPIQVAAVGASVTRAALVAYDQPNGQVLGAIEAGRAYTVTAAFGAAWLQADVAGSGSVWLKAGALLGRPEGIADLQPTEAPRIVVVSAPAAPEERYQVDAAPTPTACYHSERQAMVLGVSVGLATGDSCISQQLADEQAAESAFGMMNAALQR